MYLCRAKNIKTDEQLLFLAKNVRGLSNLRYYFDKFKIYYKFKDNEEKLENEKNNIKMDYDYIKDIIKSLENFETFLEANYFIEDFEDIDKIKKTKIEAARDFKVFNIMKENIEKGEYDDIEFENVQYWRKHADLHGYMEEKVLFPLGLDSCSTVILNKSFFVDLLEKATKDFEHHINHIKIQTDLFNEFVKEKKIIETNSILNGFEFTEGSKVEYDNKLKELIDKYNIKNNVKFNIPKAKVSGFFWGESNIKDWESTIEACNKVLDEVDFDKDIVFYEASW